MKKDFFLKMPFLILLTFLLGFPLIAHAVSKKNAESFFSFCGVQYGNNEDDVEKLFGKPDHVVSKSDSKILYYGPESKDWNGIDVKIDPTGKVTGVGLRTLEAADVIEKSGIKDPKVRLLGKYKKDVIKAFGKPDENIEGSLEYDVLNNKGRSAFIYFQCYDHNNNKCTEIFLNWEY